MTVERRSYVTSTTKALVPHAIDTSVDKDLIRSATSAISIIACENVFSVVSTLDFISTLL